MFETRWRLKGCPRCRGDLCAQSNGSRGIVWHCLQCGRTDEAEMQVIRLKRKDGATDLVVRRVEKVAV
jgi:hypothetical protein